MTPHSEPEKGGDAAILRGWRTGQVDTRDLATKFAVSEAYVYNLVSKGKWEVPQSSKVPYAGIER